MSVYDKIQNGYYENKTPYTIDEFPVDDDMTVREAREQKEAWKQAKIDQRAFYRRAEADITRLFQSDLEEEFGVKDHPKAELLWQMAWDRGHSSGYESVYYEYSDLVDLIK